MARPDLEEVRRAIRAAELRATPSRIAVLALLGQSERPLSHGEVADKLAGQAWDRATIYRNLTDFVEVGLARRSNLGDNVWRFEAVSSGHAAEQHPHFVCTSCGIVECLPQVELSLPRAKTPRSLRRNEVEVQVRGVCDGCG